ncbi:glycosyltransferase [Arthrobacter sp. AL08]|uniref:glycosyltransferase n=1 Tax=unclassified Arthrobacter TaxID=235627 RepID=UPI00249A9D73|nr:MULTISPECIES: glycosyltransferase [unclassified Arthrobacter]MDI3242483.1 glycosyltransferase [Arthrobacter sp. AL05]MDI3278521.1 glycosyltransferase [Arthrobacter sp. AL08]
MKVSIVVPCYNVETKIGRCFSSLERVGQVFGQTDFEVIFVDDCSTDGTVDKIRENQVHNPHWSIVALEGNSGSPSQPRNVGVTAARGEFVFFLDPDDEIYAPALRAQYNLAVAESADLVRTSLELAELGKPNVVVNRIVNFPGGDSRIAQMTEIVRQQSTTNSSLVRRSVLIDNAVWWPEDLHMGEDTVFLLKVLTHARRVSYLDQPGIVYHKTVSVVRSATQQYNSRDLASHLRVWEQAEQILSTVGLSYLELRGAVGIRHAIDQLYKFNARELPDSSLLDFSAFVRRHSAAITSLSVRPRIRETLQALELGDLAQIRKNLKLRLLIAGNDLKFIKAAIPALEEFYEIRIDEWPGHDIHDKARSTELLGWADVILCEWLLGNAVWYAEHKKPYQKLVVRLHLFELTRDFGRKIKQSAVDCFFSVSAHTAEDMIRTFEVDRTKVRVIPNFIVEDKYAQGSGAERLFRLGLVGPVPKRKGLMKSLHLLYSLRLQDRRYTLTIYGKRPEELPWVIKDDDERRYYEACDRFIVDHGLSEAVSYAGWVDTASELANIGFVLSLSDFESFHVAPAEAFAAGNQALFLPWRGVEFLYPRDYIHADIYSMRDYILENSEQEAFQASGAGGQEYVRSNYSLGGFTENFTDLIASI